MSHVENSFVSDARRPDGTATPSSVRFVAETTHWPVFVGSASYVVQNALASASVVNSLHAEVEQGVSGGGGGSGGSPADWVLRRENVATSSHDPSPTLHWPNEVALGLLQKSLAPSRVWKGTHWELMQGV